MKNALIVDDDEGIRRVIGIALRQIGFVVGEAANGRDGAIKAAQLSFALITMDFHMPILNGVESIKLIRSDEKTDNKPAARILAISSDDEKAQAMLAAGATAFLCKPFEIKQLQKLADE